MVDCKSLLISICFRADFFHALSASVNQGYWKSLRSAVVLASLSSEKNETSLDLMYKLLWTTKVIWSRLWCQIKTYVSSWSASQRGTVTAVLLFLGKTWLKNKTWYLIQQMHSLWTKKTNEICCEKLSVLKYLRNFWNILRPNLKGLGNPFKF